MGDLSLVDPPEIGVGDVEALVRVERDGDGVDLAALCSDEGRQALHVGVGARHGQAGRAACGAVAGGQVAEIVLGVDHQKLGGTRGHGLSPSLWLQCSFVRLVLQLSKLKGDVSDENPNG